VGSNARFLTEQGEAVDLLVVLGGGWYFRDTQVSSLESNWQLNIEDSLKISDKEIVIFVDASNEDIEDIHFSPVEPSEGKSDFTTHSASPSFVLALCIQLYGKHPETYLLQIRGYSWEFQEGLSEKAEKNLQKALDFLKKKVR